MVILFVRYVCSVALTDHLIRGQKSTCISCIEVWCLPKTEMEMMAIRKIYTSAGKQSCFPDHNLVIYFLNKVNIFMPSVHSHSVYYEYL